MFDKEPVIKLLRYPVICISHTTSAEGKIRTGDAPLGKLKQMSRHHAPSPEICPPKVTTGTNPLSPFPHTVD